VKTKIPRGTNQSLRGPQFLKWLQRIIAENYNRTESMPFSLGKKKKKCIAASDYVTLKTLAAFPLPPPAQSQLQSTRNTSRKIMVQLKARSI